MSRIISSSSRSAGLSYVITELFNYKDNEIYTVKPKGIDTTGMEGITLSNLSPYDLNLYFENATAIGGLKEEIHNHLKKGKLANSKFSCMDSCLFPSIPEKNGKEIRNYKQLYVIEEDDDRVIASKPALLEEKNIAFKTITGRNVQPTLTFGVNNVLLPLLNELAGFLSPESDIYIFGTIEKKNALVYVNQTIIEQLQSKLKIHFIGIDLDDFNTLYDYIDQHKECQKAVSAVLLSDDYSDEYSDFLEKDIFAKADDKTLSRLLFVRKIKNDLIENLNITCEMNLDENRKLAEMTGQDDFIVGSSVTALVITQLAQTRSLHRIFHEILDQKGSELYMNQIKDLMCLDQNHKCQIDWLSLSEMFAQRNEVLIGYRLR